MRNIKHIRLKSVKMMTLIIVICFTVFSGAIITYQSLIDDVKTINSKNKDIITDSCYDEILLYYNSLKTQATLESEKISNCIRDEIMIKYNKDLFILQEELDNDIYNEKIMNILKSNIQDKYLNDVKNNDNAVIVTDFNGILVDYDYSTADCKIKRSWKEEQNNQFNILLYEDSIKKILEQTNEQFIVQQKKDEGNNCSQEKISEFTIDTFKQIYYNEGIEGFKKLVFLVPTYIYNHEDIFGNSDIVNGKKVQNHKLIVIQKFNLYDQISKLSNSVIEKTVIQDIDDNGDLLLARLYILGIILLTTVIGLIFILCAVYNRVMTELRKEQEEK